MRIVNKRRFILFLISVLLIGILVGATGTYFIAGTETEAEVPEPEAQIVFVEKPVEKLVYATDYGKDLQYLAMCLYFEAAGCSDEHQQLVAGVVLNRVKAADYPDTISEVLTDTKFGKQYECGEKMVSEEAYSEALSTAPDELRRCKVNALAALYGLVEIPEGVIFQSNFKQGSGVYKELKTSYSSTYFCYR